MIHRPDPEWGSHIPILIKTVLESEGSVLELGMGISSTPLLHALCADQGKFLLSLDDEEHFVNLFRKYKNDWHDIRLIKDWNELMQSKWGVVLVDHKPDFRRAIEAVKFFDSEFVVLHDTEPENEHLYGYEKVYPHFKHRFDYKKSKVHTTVLSNVHDLNFLHNSVN